MESSWTETSHAVATETMTTAQRLGQFYKSLTAEGIPEGIAHTLVLRLFEAELNGVLINSGRSLHDFR